VHNDGATQTHGGPRQALLVGAAATPSGAGYWDVAADGGLFGFNAPFYGSRGV
jgi:hypothetical protein